LIIPLFVALFVLLQHNLPNTLSIAENTVSVPRGAFSQLELPDGTQVWLNSGSTLKYPLSFRHQTHRKVSLQGEGFFKVKKDKSTPFIVNMKGVDIRVTGTTFNARAYSDETDVTVALVEGSVLLGYPDRTDGNKFVSLAGLKPMQVAVMNKTTCRLELTNTQDMEKYIAWTKGRTMFEDDPIETLIEKFEKLYNIHVVIADKALLQYRFTATFDNESLERAIKIISLSSPISFEIVNGKKDSSGAFVQRTLILRIDKHSSRTHQPVIL
jgi:ferric-dicitrate binding protein FerR (iron transport regulator)